MKKTIFSTGKLPEDLKSQLIGLGFILTEQALITLESVPFNPELSPCDWIFFSSKNSIRFFMAGKPRLENHKFAAMGIGTAIIAKEYGSCAFIGQTNDISLVAEDFKSKVGGSRVLFPQSDRSLRSVQKALNPTQVVDLICYRTKLNPAEISDHAVYIFTSPSNAEAFLEKNILLEGRKSIAYGKKTANYLTAKGISDVILPDSLETNDLLNTILRCVIS